MIRFNEYVTNTLAEMFDHIKSDSGAAGLSLHSEDATSLVLTDGTVYIGFKNSTTFLYFSVSFTDTFTGNYLTDYFCYFNTANNFYQNSVYTLTLAVVKSGSDYGIGLWRSTATLYYVPINFYRLETTKRTLYAYGASGQVATLNYIDIEGNTVGNPAHQIETLKITENDYLYKRNLNVTGLSGFITENEFFLHAYDACFPAQVTNARCIWEMNDGKYIIMTSNLSSANVYLFKFE